MMGTVMVDTVFFAVEPFPYGASDFTLREPLLGRIIGAYF